MAELKYISKYLNPSTAESLIIATTQNSFERGSENMEEED